jgi:hypothetical protein
MESLVHDRSPHVVIPRAKRKASNPPPTPRRPKGALANQDEGFEPSAWNRSSTTVRRTS